MTKNTKWIVTGSIATIAVVGGASLAAADSMSAGIQAPAHAMKEKSVIAAPFVKVEAKRAAPGAMGAVLQVTFSAYSAVDVMSAVSAQSAASPAVANSPVSAQSAPSSYSAPSPVSAPSPYSAPSPVSANSPASAPSADSGD